MKKITFTTALVSGLLAAPAIFAADLPTYSEPVAYNPAPIHTWDGFYVGANVGYGWGRGHIRQAGVVGSGNYDGFIGGIQAGYNAQFNNLVVGLETDLQLSGVDHNEDFGPFSTSARIDWFGTTRARLGYAAGRFMPYVTGGVAYGHQRFKFAVAGVQVFNERKNHIGWTVGAGVEAAVTQNISLKAEYLYVDFDRKSYGNLGIRADADMHIARVGVNYRF